MTQIPTWLATNIKSKCECGGDIVNNDLLTQRYCSNPNCYKHIGARIDALAKKLSIKGIGPAAGEEMAKYTKYLTPVPYIVRGYPQATLAEIAEYCDFYGVSKQWSKILQGVNDPEALRGTEYEDCIPGIKEAMEYFTVRETVKSAVTVYVWITGSIEGYSNRDEFISDMNLLFEPIIKVVNNGSTISNTTVLVKEPYSNTSGKTEKARKNGIPVMSSDEFVGYLYSEFEKRGGTFDEDENG